MRRSRRILLSLLALGGAGLPGAGQTGTFHWPTANPAFAERRPYADFVQPTESGRTMSGLFGCVRTGGRQFHEGLDLLALERDRRGEATDEVVAIAPGTVRYVNKTAGWSDYGRYVVVEHASDALGMISLYAHLATVARNVGVGENVQAGQVLGVMGRSAASYTIPRARAHLHFELGVWLSRSFQSWYDAQHFSNRNRHGVFNGYNIVGLDFLDFAERHRAGEVRDIRDYVARLPVAVSVVVRNTFEPDFVERYPALLDGEVDAGELAGWQIDFTWFGLPKFWRPMKDDDLLGLGNGGPTVVFHDEDLLQRFPCQQVVQLRGGVPLPGQKLRQALAILFTDGR